MENNEGEEYFPIQVNQRLPHKHRQLDRLRKNENVNSYTLNQLCKILIAGLKILQNMWKMNKKFCLISK